MTAAEQEAATAATAAAAVTAAAEAARGCRADALAAASVAAASAAALQRQQISSVLRFLKQQLPQQLRHLPHRIFSWHFRWRHYLPAAAPPLRLPALPQPHRLSL
ncbi:hypothetical protein ACSSS7_006837 [Eimeria intestinalis]